MRTVPDMESDPSLKKKKIWFFISLAALIVISIYLIPITSPRYKTFKKIKEIAEEEKKERSNKIEIFVYKVTSSKMELLADRSKVQAGDNLKLGYFFEKKHFGVIFSINGAGEVTLRYPLSSESSTIFEAQTKVILDNVFTLNEAPLFETFYLVSSKSKINSTALLEDLRKQVLVAKQLNPEKKFITLDSRKNMASITLLKK